MVPGLVGFEPDRPAGTRVGCDDKDSQLVGTGRRCLAWGLPVSEASGTIGEVLVLPHVEE